MATGKLFKNVTTVPTVSKNGDYPAKIAKFTSAQDASYVTLKPYLKTKKGVQKFASILFKIENVVEENSPQSQFVSIFKHADSDEDITIKVGHSEKGTYPNIMKVKAKKAKTKAVVAEEDDVEDDDDLEIDEEVTIDDDDLEVADDGEDEEELEED